MNNTFSCKECPYFWANEEDDYPHCNFVERCPGDMAPCEYDEYDYDEYEADYDEEY